MVNQLAYGLSIFFLLLLAAGAANLILSFLSFAPWVPSRSRDLARILKLADLRDNQSFFDLGCGDGKIVFSAAAGNRNARAVGLEISWPLFLICRFKQFFKRRRNASFKLKNLFKENLSAADVVYFFGIPKTINGRLAAKLKQELKPGAKIISYAFRLNGWTPKIVDKPSEKDLAIYLYIV